MRRQPECDENRIFIQNMRYNFLTRCRDQLPKTVLDKSWPKAPELLADVRTDNLDSVSFVPLPNIRSACGVAGPLCLCFAQPCITLFVALSSASTRNVRACRFCFQLSEELRTLNMANMVRKYCKRITPEMKLQVTTTPTKEHNAATNE